MELSERPRGPLRNMKIGEGGRLLEVFQDFVQWGVGTAQSV
jgi:hypothetical protein